MTTAQIIRSSQALMLVLVLCVTASAQTPVAVPRRPETQPPKPLRPVQVETTVSAPQVVTILHSLNGLKVIRLLLRGKEQLGALASLDEAFQMSGEVHTNVIAGLALSDGQTIAAWLPEAEAELPTPMLFAPAAPARPGSSPKATNSGSPAFQGFSPADFQRSFASVDVKVVARDGRNLLGRYVGLDGLTGLSVITLSNSNLPKSTDAIEDSIQAGQHVRLIGPELASQTAPGAKGGIYVRVGKTDATVVDVIRSATKTLSRVRIKSPKITRANIGAVAVNDSDEPLGIVNAVEGNEASIVPVGLVRSAASRVIARQASVPRPWLGVRGESIGKLTLERILKVGWQAERARALAEKRQGLLLTSVVPGSPAAWAELKPGDVIMSVNDEMVQNADDFSMFLQDAAPGSFVNFTVARPGTAASEAFKFKIKLAESPDPSFGYSFFHEQKPATRSPRSLVPGIETIAIKPPVAARLGATGGLLIVYVQPGSAAFVAGLRAGDVIESVNGESTVTRSASGLINQSTSATVVVVRNKKRVTIAIPPANK
ncbi:MAG: PDZ domain-containing protein [Pyrinomonadaceae bacterium]